MLYSFTFSIHIVISSLTLLAGFTTLVFAAQGWIRQRDWSRLDSLFSLVFSLSLYLQLVLGFIIYFTLRTTLEGEFWSVPNTENDASLRFWAIEHIALMIFALFLTQLGRIFIRKSTLPVRKFKASLFYYGCSMFLILFSLSVALFFR
jgi:hypothetical protein